MNPLEIYQEALNIVSEAVLAEDFHRYAAMIDLPYLVHTATADLLVTTTAALRPTFDGLAKGLKKRGIDRYERVAREADYVARDRISGWHHTHVLSNGQSMAYPHVSHHTLVRRGQRWLFSEAHYGTIAANTWPLSERDMFGHVDKMLVRQDVK